LSRNARLKVGRRGVSRYYREQLAVCLNRVDHAGNESTNHRCYKAPFRFETETRLPKKAEGRTPDVSLFIFFGAAGKEAAQSAECVASVAREEKLIDGYEGMQVRQFEESNAQAALGSSLHSVALEISVRELREGKACLPLVANCDARFSRHLFLARDDSMIGVERWERASGKSGNSHCF